MRQVAMAIGDGARQTVWTGGAERSIGGRPWGLLIEDGRRIRKGNSMPGVELVVGDASGSASKSAVSVVSDCCKMYYPEVLRPSPLHYAANGKPGTFAGSSLVNGLVIIY